MRRLVQDLGELTGLDIVAAARCAPVRDAAARSERPPTGAGLALGALRWLGLTPAGDGRCRLDGAADLDGARTPHAARCGIRTDGPIGPPPAPRHA